MRFVRHFQWWWPYDMDSVMDVRNYFTQYSHTLIEKDFCLYNSDFYIDNLKWLSIIISLCPHVSSMKQLFYGFIDMFLFIWFKQNSNGYAQTFLEFYSKSTLKKKIIMLISQIRTFQIHLGLLVNPNSTTKSEINVQKSIHITMKSFHIYSLQ